MREEPCIESLKNIQLLQAKEFISRCFLPENTRPSAAGLLDDSFLSSKVNIIFCNSDYYFPFKLPYF